MCNKLCPCAATRRTDRQREFGQAEANYDGANAFVAGRFRKAKTAES
jgi:hypothetical protein